MTLSRTTLAALRRAAIGSAVVAATGLSAVALTGASASERSDTPTVPVEAPSAPVPVPVEAPFVLDGDDCPACGLG